MTTPSTLSKEKEEKLEKFTLFSDDKENLPRRQLGATFHVMLLMWCVAGKYVAGGKKPGGPRTAIFSDDKLEKLQPLVGLMQDIGSGHGSKTPAQVAINWVMCKGAIPIVGEFFLGLCSSCFLLFAALIPLRSFVLYCAVLLTLFYVLTPLRPCLSCYVL